MYPRVQLSYQYQPGSVLASLRSLVPERQLQFTEALRIAELQATRLRELTDVADDAMPESTISKLPRLCIVRRRLPTSGMSYWNGHCWVIALNSSEPESRQRFTLFHEYKHVIDHARTERLYVGNGDHAPAEQAEQAADYFAGCVLMPKRLMKRAWCGGVQRSKQLAELFDVSTRAAEVRLAQIGLNESRPRCAPPPRASGGTRGRYYRRSSMRSAIRMRVVA
ncbi:MAG: ImmA/IrrE family metallo-endopeptidase [Nocardioidaceae bacterium]